MNQNTILPPKTQDSQTLKLPKVDGIRQTVPSLQKGLSVRPSRSLTKQSIRPIRGVAKKNS